MSMTGVYRCAALGATLEIKTATNNNGQGSGTFTMGGATWDVGIRYHFLNDGGPQTVLQMWASHGSANSYVTASAYTSNTNASEGIQFAGGSCISTGIAGATGFTGLFKK
ncbi:MAG: hypothetical protein ACI837_001713 [Crocinitomicaceae bacterium]|jgi:hypothetical protein